MADISAPASGSNSQVRKNKPAPPVRRSSLIPDKCDASDTPGDSRKVSKDGKPAPPARKSSIVYGTSNHPMNDGSKEIVQRRNKGEKPPPPNRVSSLNPRLSRMGSLQYINPGWGNSQRDRINSDSSVENDKNIGTVQQTQHQNSPDVMVHMSPQERNDFIEKEFEKINEMLQIVLSQI